MSERRGQRESAELAAMGDDALGSALSASAADAFPPTPPIAELVRARLEREEGVARDAGAAPAGAQRQGRPRFAWPALPVRRATLIALLALLALAAVVGAVILGVPGIRIGTLGPSPSLTPTIPAMPSGSVGERLGLGELTTADQASELAGFDVLTPTVLGPADEVYVANIPPTHQVAHVWRPRTDLPEASTTGVGALLMQFPGLLIPDQYEKLVTESTRVEAVTIRGGRGFWIEGGTHFFVESPTRATEWQEERIRLAGNTLVWQEGELTFRLEADVDFERAREIAESLAP